MNQKSEYAHRLAAWLTGDDASRNSLCIADSAAGWDTFVQASAACLILPSLHHDSGKFRLEGKLPDEIATLLSTVHALNRERNETALAQIREMAAGLNKVGIQPVVLKGVANILSGVYPDLGTRYLADIDILIPRQQFPEALTVLRNLGYSSTPPHQVEFNIGHTYPPFTRPDSLEIDLHRTLGLSPCPAFLPASDVIREAAVHDFNGASVLIPSPTHLVMHHIMHSQIHDVYRERIAPSLRTLYDFYLLNQHFQSDINWADFEAYFRQNGQYAALALYLLEVEDTFGTRSPIPIRLTAMLRFRRWRRKILQNWPSLRFGDPAYYYRAGFQPRTRRLREIVAQPHGVHYLLQKFSDPAFYARLKSDFRP